MSWLRDHLASPRFAGVAGSQVASLVVGNQVASLVVSNQVASSFVIGPSLTLFLINYIILN